MADPVAWMSTAATALVGAGAREVVFSAVVFAVVWVLCRALRHRGPALRHALWALVFVRLLLPPGVSHPWSAGAIAGYLWGGGPGGQPVSAGDAAALAALAAGPAEAHGGEMAPASGWALAIAVLWLGGVTLWLFFYERRCRRYRQVLREAKTLDDPRAAALAEGWAKRLRIRRRVALLTSAARVSPFTAGILRPLIFLPRAVLDDEVVLESALAHELAHVARWDSLWLRLQHLVQALYFFHPLLWLASRELDREREQICDAVVLARGRVDARAYAKSLLAVLELEPERLAVPQLIHRKRRLAMRIHNILAPSDRRGPEPRTALAITFVLGCFLLPLAGGTGADDSPQLVNPLPESGITARYGQQKDPWSGEPVFHRGIDLRGDFGTPVLAPADGVVETATTHYEQGERFGTVVVVDHGHRLKTFYAHLGALKVREGQRVARHDTLAEVGSTGKSTGPHLHFEIWRDGEPVDPAEWVPDWKSPQR